MDLLSPSLRAVSLLWQPRPGAWFLTIVCKATYTLAPGTSPLADEQEPPNDDDTHWNDDPARSLSAVTDLVPFKPRAEVLLVGHAFAPGKVPARSVVARLAVGDVDKSIEVFCDRWWTAVRTVREGPRFTRASLRYERAAGGPGTENPVGVRPDGPADKNGLVPLPNLQPAGLVVVSRADVIAPIGFGPISPTWPGRADKLGAQGAAWSHGEPLPEGIDGAYFNAAPPDQQLDEIDAAAPILLENLHPEYPILETCLPGIRPRVVVERPGVHPEEVAMRCDTLWIDTDRSICTLTWRGRLGETHPDEDGRIVVTVVELEEPPTGDVWITRAARLAAPVARQAPQVETGGTVFLFDASPMPAPPRSTPASVPPPQDEVHGTVFLLPPVAREIAREAGEPGLPDVAPPALVPLVEIGPVTAVLDASMLAPAAPPAPPPLVVGAGQHPATQPPGTLALPSLLSVAIPIGADRLNLVEAHEEYEKRRRAEPEPPGEPLPRQEPRPAPPELIELLWFDAAYTKRIRAQPEWRALLTELENRALDRSRASGSLEDDRWTDRGDVFEIVARGAPLTPVRVKDALEAATGEDGRVDPPLVLVAGRLRLTFDEIESLKAAVAAVRPLLGAADKRLTEAADAGMEILASPWPESVRALAERCVVQIRKAFDETRQHLERGYVDELIERAVLRGRCYQRRTVLGHVWLRALLDAGGSPREALLVYLPESLANELPMFPEMKARIVAEVRTRQDKYEEQATALRAVAVARVG